MVRGKKNTIGLLLILSLSFLFLVADVKLVYATTTTFDASAGLPCGNGQISKSSADYATAHDATNGDACEWTDNGVRQFGQRYTGTEYIIWRSPTRWNTASLPDSCTITSAKIRLYLVEYGDMSDTDFIVRIQNWTEGNGAWADTTDYDGFDGINYDDGTSNTASWVEQTYNNITLSNFDVISKTGYTEVMVRSSRDVNSNTPTGYELLACGDYHNTAQDPQLVVTYSIPPSVYNQTISAPIAVAALPSKSLSKNLIESQFFTLTGTLSKVFSRNVFESQLFRFVGTVSLKPFQLFRMLSMGVSIGQTSLQWLISGAGGHTYPYQLLQAVKIIGNIFKTSYITYHLSTTSIFGTAVSRIRTVTRDVFGSLSIDAIVPNVQYLFGKVLLDDIRGFLGLSSITYPYVAPTVPISGGSPGVVTPAEEAAAAQAIAAAAVYGMSTEVLQRVSIGIAAAMALIFIWGVTGETKKNGKKKKRSWNI